MVTAVGMVREGLGITVLPRMALDSLKMDDMVFRRFAEPRPTRRVGVIHRTDRVLSASETFLRYLFEQCESSQLSSGTRPRKE